MAIISIMQKYKFSENDNKKKEIKNELKKHINNK